jgi:hypothetical protein
MAKGIEFNPRNDFLGVGDYDIPMLEPNDIGETKHLRWIPYTSAGSFRGDKSRTAVHFFIYDKGFENIWDLPIKLARLKGFALVATPDFSCYTDMPIAFQIWNRFRSHWIGCYMQQTLKLKVIPTLCWSTPDTYSFMFDGIPFGSPCIMSSVGYQVKRHNIYNLHLSGLREAINVIHPEKILVYGTSKEFYTKYEYEDITPFCHEMLGRKKIWDARIAKSFPKGQGVYELD